MHLITIINPEVWSRINPAYEVNPRKLLDNFESVTDRHVFLANFENFLHAKYFVLFSIVFINIFPTS